MIALLDIPTDAFRDADERRSSRGGVRSLDEPEVTPVADVPDDPLVTILLDAPLIKRYPCSKRLSFIIEDGRWVAAHLLIITAVITPAYNCQR